jgi:atypical dual specificity phosphatase
MARFELDSRTLRVILGLILGRPSNFSWFREGKIAGSGLPVGEKGYRWLKDHGVSAILCLTEDAWGKQLAQKLGLEYRHLPMVNRHPEVPLKLDQAVDAIKDILLSGKKVLVHCQAGQGRTGMVLAAFLIREEGFHAQDAIDYVRKVRPGSLKRKRQVEALHEYERYLSSLKKEEEHEKDL